MSTGGAILPDSSPQSHAPSPRKAGARAAYAPLVALNLVALAAAFAVAVGYFGAVGMTVHAYVGFLLCSLGSLKLFDLQDFADGFQQYDVLAARWRGYSYVYAFLELALGLAYLAYLEPVTVYFASVALFTFSGLGVFNTLDGKLDLKAPVLIANGLRAPLPIVTAMESVIVVIIALVMLWR